MTSAFDSDVTPADLQRAESACEQIRSELRRVIVGQDQVIDELLISLLAGGHALLVGVPGLAKTLLVRALAEVTGITFQRIQFTPDLMPADITGTEVIHEDRASGERSFRFIPGPLFAQIVLADEINRTPPKTQAALLEAMQEQQVTVGGARHQLPEPFFVLATENPIEQEGTYPLPEAQLDRFMMEIRVGYPSEEEELQIVQRRRADSVALSQIVDADDLLKFRQTVRAIPMAEHDMKYAVALTRATRTESQPGNSEFRRYVSWGAGPRATEWLVLAALAHACLRGKTVATSADIQAVAPSVLRHRLVLNFHAQADGMTSDRLIERLLDTVPLPADAPRNATFKKLFSGSKHR